MLLEIIEHSAAKGIKCKNENLEFGVRTNYFFLHNFDLGHHTFRHTPFVMAFHCREYNQKDKHAAFDHGQLEMSVPTHQKSQLEDLLVDEQASINLCRYRERFPTMTREGMMENKLNVTIKYHTS